MWKFQPPSSSQNSLHFKCRLLWLEGGSEFFTFFPISIILQLFCNITFIRNVYISNFSQFRSRGGVIKNQIFPKFKIVHIILGGGEGVKKIMDFFHNLWHFLFGLLPLPKSSCVKTDHLGCTLHLTVGGPSNLGFDPWNSSGNFKVTFWPQLHSIQQRQKWLLWVPTSEN